MLLDGVRVPARAAAQFLAAAGRNADAADIVEAAVAAAMGCDGGGDEQPPAADGVLAAAGRACLAALHDTLDALGTGGAAEVAREARAFRDETSMVASAGARGAFAATVLRVAAAREMAAAAK
eukprot:4760920-Pleurochrysis_carterae.AAC.2